MTAGYLDRTRVREFFEERLDRSSEQRRFRLAGTARLASQSGINLGREFQVQFRKPSVAEPIAFYHPP